MASTNSSEWPDWEPRPGPLPPCDPSDLAVRLSEIALALREEDTAQDTLQAIVEAAVGTVPGAEFAGVSVIEVRTKVRTPAATDVIVKAVDQAQHDTGEGPCLDALYEHAVVPVPDMTTERRWPAFTARAAELGVGSMLSFQLFVAADSLGALNLYSLTPRAFDADSEYVGALFSSHASVALAGAQKEAELLAGMHTRDLIGQAKGILMERYKITSDQAFAVLVRTSQTTNSKLRAVADHLVHSGDLGLLPAPEL